jgi:serine/threonine protein kinase
MDETVLFGRYRLLEPAGSGGTAEVWRALDERTNDEVAVKRLHPIVFADEAARERLAREFEALQRLDHQNIVRVRDLHLDRDDGAIVLEYVPGASLADRQRQSDAPLPRDEALSIARDVAAALAAAHDAGIVHRDVTPANILLAPDGSARLTDFGIAQADPDATAVTATGLLVGTLRYLAPEQLRGVPATTASDQFALAAVTYEMLAGRPPYAATTPVALAEAHQAGPPPPIDTIEPELDATIRRALAAEPADRFPSVAAFGAALASTKGDATQTYAAIPPPAHRRRRPSPVAIAAAVGLAAVLAIGALGFGQDGSDTADAPEMTPTTPDAIEIAAEPMPTPTPTPAPAAKPAPPAETSDQGKAKSKGKDKGSGKGKGKGQSKGKGRGN